MDFSVRRPSQTSRSDVRRRRYSKEESWEHIPRPMAARPSDDAVLALEAKAKKVGEEVEIFGQKVDMWLRQKRSHESTFRLVNRLKLQADNQVVALKKRHADTAQRALNKEWRRRALEFNGTGSVSSSTEASNAEGRVAEGSDDSTLEDLRRWQSEASTWRLLQLLLHLRNPPPDVDMKKRKADELDGLGPVHKFSPESKVFQRFMIEDHLARERQIILDWLQSTAEETGGDLGSIVEQLEAGSGTGKGTWSQGWIETRAMIKNRKRLHAIDRPVGIPGDHISIRKMDTNAPMVTQLDADAVIRQGPSCTLQRKDEYYERSLWIALWEMLRRGTPWEDVSQWCRAHNESWRSFSLGGLGAIKGTCQPFSAPGTGTLFRRTCLAASSLGLNEYERAVYGFLGGDVDSVIQVCHTWEDHLFAHFNSLSISEYEAWLRRRYPTKIPVETTAKFTSFDALTAHGGPAFAAQHIVELLAANKKLSKQSKQPMRLIQGSLIAGTFKDFVYQVGLAIGQSMNADPKRHVVKISAAEGRQVEDCYKAIADEPYALRVVTHILIVYQALGLNFGTEEETKVFESVYHGYIDLLQAAGKIEIVPTYGLLLSEFRKNIAVGTALRHIKDVDEQQRMAGLLEVQGYDTDMIFTQLYAYVVENTLRASKKDQDAPKISLLEAVKDEDSLWPGYRVKRDFMNAAANADEEDCIHTVAWYIHTKGSWSNTFSNIADLMKLFLRQGRMRAAVALVQRLPSRTVSSLKTPQEVGRGGFHVFEDPIPDAPKPEHSLRRSARHSVNKPPAPTRTNSDVEVMVQHLKQEAMVYYQLEILATAFAALDQWAKLEDKATKTLKARDNEQNHLLDLASGLHAELKDAFGMVQTAIGPMFADFLSIANDEKSMADLKTIRELYIPQIVLAYLSVLHSASYYLDQSHVRHAMDLAQKIAEKTNQNLVDSFIQTKNMRALVDAMAKCSATLLKHSEWAPWSKGVDGKKKQRKVRSEKRGRDWEGETSRIWEIGAYN